jgi:uncharacterized protein YegJ (DUF2314 family)
LEHDTHITIQMMNNGSDLDEEGRQRLFARFLAYFTWYPHTRAVLQPRENRGRVWDKKLRKALRDLPLREALRHAPGKEEPVTRVTPSDEEIHKASEEARRRWPEFVAAWEKRTEGMGFLVKAPFKEGEHVEHMWVEALALEDEFVVGKVLNDPVNVPKFKKGGKVRFRSKIVSDWFYGSRDGEKVGMFVERLLHEKDRQAAAPDDEDEDDFDDEGAGPPVAARQEEPVQDRPPRERARPAVQERAPAPRRSAPAVKAAPPGLSPAVLGGICLAAVLAVAGLAYLGYRLFRGQEAQPDPLANVGPQPGQGGNPRPGPDQGKSKEEGGKPGPDGKRPKEGPQRRGGASDEYMTRLFAEALQKKDLRAAYDCLSPAFQERQPFADFEKAVRDHKILEGPMPLRLRPAGKDARGRPVREAHFNRLTRDLPPLFKAACATDSLGWWVDGLDWTPGAAERALAGLGKGFVPKERGGNSSQHIMEDFLRALQKKDLRAAYACTTLEFQKRQPFAEFEKAVRDNRVWEGPLPLRLGGGGVDAQKRPVAEIRFARFPFNRVPLLKAACVTDETGWWIDDLAWTPGVVENALKEEQEKQAKGKKRPG